MKLKYQPTDEEIKTAMARIGGQRALDQLAGWRGFPKKETVDKPEEKTVTEEGK